jgi:hypothetical protein
MASDSVDEIDPHGKPVKENLQSRSTWQGIGLKNRVLNC